MTALGTTGVRASPATASALSVVLRSCQVRLMVLERPEALAVASWESHWMLQVVLDTCGAAS